MKRDCKVQSGKKDTRELNPKLMRVVEEKSMFVKNVVVAGITLKALVDTGGKVSTIQEKYAKIVGELKPSRKVLRGFGKKEVTVSSKVCTDLLVDGITLPVELQVVPTWVQDTAIILGEDVIDQDRLIMVKRKGDVKFSWEKETESVIPALESGEQTGESSVARMYTIAVAADKEIEKELLNTDGDHQHKQQLITIVRQYRNCFALNMMEMGCAKSTVMKINLSCDEPVYMKPRRVEYARQNVLHVG
ncbi:uncharacterized protein LOC134210024 [Armigeres subalbatus]|uniref:uncharacterized protein LOC134210024 n=1 Tax=Armigeres subalbatus TaxID=124917 RepID=UPI002ED2CFF9